MGSGYWRMMAFVVLPQALRLVIPGIVNSFISLFKDTSLVLIVSIFDLLGQLRASFADPTLVHPGDAVHGLCIRRDDLFRDQFGMSRYALFTERRLSAAQ